MSAPARYRSPKVLVTILVGLLSAVSSLVLARLIPSVHHDLGPAVVSASARFGPGSTTIVVPPLGTISADTHSSFLNLRLSISEIDPGPLADAVGAFSARGDLIESIEADLRSTFISNVLRLILGGLVIGVIVAAVLPHRTRATLIAGAVGGSVAMAVTLGITAMTFKVEAFEEPKFTGALERAPQVIEAVNRGFGSFDELRSRYEVLAARLSELLTLAATPVSTPEEDSVAILHVSDIHSNPIGVEIARDLALKFEVDAVVDTGDLTSFGQGVEARIGSLIEDIGVPYLYVPGNHDSDANRREIADVDNVQLLDGDMEIIDGVRIFGIADPTFTATNETSTSEANETKFALAPEVADLIDRNDPDVVAVHDVRQASESFGLIPLILAGHTHERSFVQENGTTIMTVGSTGATGIGSFLVETELDYEAEIIYFRDGEPISYDYISFDGLGGDFTIERRKIETLELTPPPADLDTPEPEPTP